MSIEVQSDLFAGDSHASPIHWQADTDQARKTTVTSGRKCFELFGRYSPIGSLAKMFLESSAWNSTTCLLTWEVRSTSRHLIFRLSPSMPDTCGIESGSSEEPSVWPTPTQQDNIQIRQMDGAKGHKDRSTTLGGAVKLWPTPRASEWKGTSPLGSKSQEHRLARHYLDATVQEVEQINGRLSSRWVEWLMGFPVGWTSLDH